MKLAQVIFAGAYAGAERVACLLAEALAERHESSHLYLIRELRAGRQACAVLSERVAQHGLGVREFDTDRRFSRSLGRRLLRQVRDDKLDLIHCHSYKAAFYFGWAHRLGWSPPPTVFTLHGMDLARWRDHVFIQGLNLMGAYLSDAVVACSQPIARTYAGKFPGLAHKLHTIPNGVTIEARQQVDRIAMRARLAERLGLEADTRWLACIGRLVEVKNHRLLLSAFGDLCATQPNVRLLIIGDGPLETELRTESRRLGLESRVRFCGYVADMDEWYPALDAVVLSSTTEGTPMVLLEAGKHGLPVVASRVGGVPDLVCDGETGLLFTSGDRNALATALGRVAEDAELRRALGDAARRWVEEQFGHRRWADRHTALYQSLLGLV